MKRVVFSVFLLLVAVVLGAFLFRQFLGRPQVGVVRITGVLVSQEDADNIVKMLRYTRATPEIRAVVLEIDSPGGSASIAEDIYLNVLELRREKPVVASINGIGASGAYYIAAAAQTIFAKPTSFVGSVGAWTFLPGREDIGEDLVPTGPFKVTGGSRAKMTVELEMVKEAFLEAVFAQRQDRLKLSREELGRAEVYSGIEGLNYGLVDRIASGTEALEEAARLARISHYGVININELLKIPPPFSFFFLGSLHNPNRLVPGIYYLYMEPR